MSLVFIGQSQYQAAYLHTLEIAVDAISAIVGVNGAFFGALHKLVLGWKELLVGIRMTARKLICVSGPKITKDKTEEFMTQLGKRIIKSTELG